MSDNFFTYIDEHEECDDISSDAIDKRVPKVNKDGKKVRGKEIEWRYVKVFADVEEFQESEIKKEIVDCVKSYAVHCFGIKLL